MTRATWLLGFALAVGACSKNEDKKLPLGRPMPADTPTATIEQVTKDKSFIGRTVAVEGRVGGVGCTDCAGVLVTDKTWRLLVEPEDKTKFQIPANSGARIRVWGFVVVENDDAEEGEGTEGEGGDAHAKLHQELDNVALKAIGVEWL